MFQRQSIAPTLSSLLRPTCTVWGASSTLSNNKGSPPYKNHSSLNTLRENTRKPVTGMDSWDPDLRGSFYRLFIIGI